MIGYAGEPASAGRPSARAPSALLDDPTRLRTEHDDAASGKMLTRQEY